MTTNSPKSQDEVHEILVELWKAGGAYDHVSEDMAGANDYIEQAKQKLLAWRRTTSLEALPEYHEITKTMAEQMPSTAQRASGFNQAIDLTKKNMESQ